MPIIIIYNLTILFLLYFCFSYRLELELLKLKIELKGDELSTVKDLSGQTNLIGSYSVVDLIVGVVVVSTSIYIVYCIGSAADNNALYQLYKLTNESALSGIRSWGSSTSSGTTQVQPPVLPQTVTIRPPDPGLALPDVVSETLVIDQMTMAIIDRLGTF